MTSKQEKPMSAEEWCEGHSTIDWETMTAYAYYLSDFKLREREKKIAEAIAKYRKDCPESYTDSTDQELIVAVLGSVGFFGKMAARAIKERNEREKEWEEWHGALVIGYYNYSEEEFYKQLSHGPEERKG